MTLSRRTVLKGAGATFVLATPGILRAQSDALRIGVMYALSGPGAPVGEALLAGTRMAFDQINADGGIGGRQVELEVRDDKYNGAAAVSAAQELSGMGINLMIGGSQTVTALGVLPVLPDVNAVMIAPAAAGMPVTKEAFNRHIFRTTSNVYTQYRAMAQALMEKNPDVANWAIVVPEGAYGQGVARYFSEAITAGGKAISEPIYVSATGTDFRVPINQLMSSDAEGVLLGIVGAPQISFLQQGRSVGFYDKIKVVGDAGNEAVLGAALGRNLPSNVWSVSYGNTMLDPLASNPIAQRIQSDYQAGGGAGAPPGLMLAGHRAATALTAGITKAGETGTDAVIAALEGLTFDTAGGPYSIRAEDHQGLGTNYYVKMEPSETAVGNYAITDQVGIAEADFADPATPGKAFEE